MSSWSGSLPFVFYQHVASLFCIHPADLLWYTCPLGVSFRYTVNSWGLGRLSVGLALSPSHHLGVHTSSLPIPAPHSILTSEGFPKLFIEALVAHQRREITEVVIKAGLWRRQTCTWTPEERSLLFLNHRKNFVIRAAFRGQKKGRGLPMTFLNHKEWFT